MSWNKDLYVHSKLGKYAILTHNLLEICFVISTGLLGRGILRSHARAIGRWNLDSTAVSTHQLFKGDRDLQLAWTTDPASDLLFQVNIL